MLNSVGNMRITITLPGLLELGKEQVETKYSFSFQKLHISLFLGSGFLICRLGLPLLCDDFCFNGKHIISAFLSKTPVSILRSPDGLL